jgi:hypothetical protein
MTDNLKEHICKQLQKYGKTYIPLSAIEKWVSGKYTYDDFANVIYQLQSERILIPTKTAKTNEKKRPLALKFRLNIQSFFAQYHHQLHQKQHVFHPKIRLDAYFKLEESTFKKELPMIEAIDRYLKTFGMPKELMYIPQLSLKLVGNEKWIDDLGGMTLLKRIGLWEELPIIDRIDPVAFTIDPNKISKDVQYHLIVENKTPYRQCSDFIQESGFSTVIYGKGKQICSGIRLFLEQYPVNAVHRFVYFGDIDWEGLGIYKSLADTVSLEPGIYFYGQMLRHAWISGKENQRENSAALDFFIEAVLEKTQGLAFEKIQSQLKQEFYLPQEVLEEEEICQIMQQSRSDYESI